MGQTDSAKARGPVETGGFSARTIKSDDGQCLNMDMSYQNSSPQLWGRSNIQASPKQKVLAAE